MKTHGYRLYHENPQIVGVSNEKKSKAKSDFEKNLPYLHIEKGIDELNFNGQVPFDGQEDIAEADREYIKCSHFSTVLGLNALAHPHGKIDLLAVDSPEHIAASIKKEAEQNYDSICANSSYVSAFDNDKFADFLKEQFRIMDTQPFNAGDAIAAHGGAIHEAGSNTTSQHTKGIKTFLIESTNHAMLLRLRVKEKKGETAYVISFYDPNTTACLVRCKVSDPAELGKIAGSHSLAAFISPMVDGEVDTDGYKTYFPEGSAEIAIAIEVPRPGEKVSSEMKAAGRKLQSRDCELSPALMFHLMRLGLSGSIDEITASLSKTDTAPTRDLLEAKDAHDTPSLHWALQNGQVEAIDAWGKLLVPLLALLPDNERSTILEGLLEATDADGTAGLAMALQDDRAGAIVAWGKLLALLPDNEKRSTILEGLLEAADEYGTPGLYLALQEGNAKAVKSWGSLLSNLPKETHPHKMAKLIFAVCEDGDTAIKALLKAKDEETSSAWRALLAYLPDNTESLKIAAITALKNQDKKNLSVLSKELNNVLKA